MGDKRSPELNPEEPFCAVMRKLIAARFGTVWKKIPAAVAGDDIEGVHDVRVASRRLRAAMDVAVDCFPAEWYRPLHKEAKDITSALGAVRDLDVQIEALSYQRLNTPPEEWPGIDRLLHRLEGERESARKHMLEYLTNVEARDVAKTAAERFGAAAGDEGAAS
jgi:CHAD domain-containing protein